MSVISCSHTSHFCLWLYLISVISCSHTSHACLWLYWISVILPISLLIVTVLSRCYVSNIHPSQFYLWHQSVSQCVLFYKCIHPSHFCPWMYSAGAVFPTFTFHLCLWLYWRGVISHLHHQTHLWMLPSARHCPHPCRSAAVAPPCPSSSPPAWSVHTGKPQSAACSPCCPWHQWKLQPEWECQPLLCGHWPKPSELALHPDHCCWLRPLVPAPSKQRLSTPHHHEVCCTDLAEDAQLPLNHIIQTENRPVCIQTRTNTCPHKCTQMIRQ